AARTPLQLVPGYRASRRRPEAVRRTREQSSHESLVARAARPSKEYWPCKSNSVRLGSAPRAPTRVGGLRASAGVLATGPVESAYSSESPPARFDDRRA